jgi:hypothetical protein
MSKNKLSDSWKEYEKDLMEPISDKFTDVVEYLTPQRKSSSKAPNEEEDYFKEVKKKRKARYEALKEKYKDG